MKTQKRHYCEVIHQNVTNFKIEIKRYNTRQLLHSKFDASRVKTSQLGVEFQRVFKSPGKIGLNTPCCHGNASAIMDLVF